MQGLRLGGQLAAGGGLPASTAPQFVHGYQYNAASQRERQTLANGAYWDYDYDALGQVTAGKKRWVDNAPVAGQQFEYAFDEIGNRLSTQAGGNASGGNLRLADYDVNRLNQYERRTVPAAIDVLGAAPVGSNVTVNTQSVERRGAYYRQELSIPNSSTSVWQTVDVDVAPLGSVDKTGKVFVPKSPEVFAQDADGNLTQDGRWNYTWDAENRLIKQASRTDAPNAAPSGSERCLVFEYDYRSRRIGKKVWPNTAGTGTAALDERYLYDGWNLAAVINSSSALTKFFVWGLDLSGTMQGAGGVGGLLWGRMNGPAPRFAAYDGNGNVSALVNGSSGAVDAQYEYGPFGELIRPTGTMAKNNPFRFSTKYQDDETDQLYYGYRFYNPLTGRWLSRDPIGERGGINLYGFVANTPINLFDRLGQNYSLCTGIRSASSYNRASSGPDTSCSGGFEMCARYFNFQSDGYYGVEQYGLDDSMMLDAVQSSDVTQFIDNLLLKTRSAWKCGGSGKLMNHEFFPYFNPMNDVWQQNDGLAAGARWLDWWLAGNFQMIVSGTCKWECDGNCDLDSCSPCNCHSSCDIEVMVSKYYTFAYVPGGNAGNVAGSAFPAVFPTTSYTAQGTRTTQASDCGTKKCDH